MSDITNTEKKCKKEIRHLLGFYVCQMWKKAGLVWSEKHEKEMDNLVKLIDMLITFKLNKLFERLK